MKKNMSKEKERMVKDLSGRDLDANRPKVKLVPRIKQGPHGTTVTVFEEIPVEAISVIEGKKAPVREIEERVKVTPSRHALKDHHQVDPSVWGKFRGTEPKVIHGQQPRERLIPERGPSTGPLAGRTIPTRSEVVTEAGLLRRTLERLLGGKEQK